MSIQIKLVRRSKPSRCFTTGQQIDYVQRALALLWRREREKASGEKFTARQHAAHAQWASRALTEFTRLVMKGAIGEQ